VRGAARVAVTSSRGGPGVIECSPCRKSEDGFRGGESSGRPDSRRGISTRRGTRPTTEPGTSQKYDDDVEKNEKNSRIGQNQLHPPVEPLDWETFYFHPGERPQRKHDDNRSAFFVVAGLLYFRSRLPAHAGRCHLAVETSQTERTGRGLLGPSRRELAVGTAPPCMRRIDRRTAVRAGKAPSAAPSFSSNHGVLATPTVPGPTDGTNEHPLCIRCDGSATGERFHRQLQHRWVQFHETSALYTVGTSILRMSLISQHTTLNTLPPRTCRGTTVAQP